MCKRNIETERQRDRETERQRDREIERERGIEYRERQPAHVTGAVKVAYENVTSQV